MKTGVKQVEDSIEEATAQIMRGLAEGKEELAEVRAETQEVKDLVVAGGEEVSARLDHLDHVNRVDTRLARAEEKIHEQAGVEAVSQRLYAAVTKAAKGKVY